LKQKPGFAGRKRAIPQELANSKGMTMRNRHRPHDPNQAEFCFSETIVIHCESCEDIFERVSDVPTARQLGGTPKSELELAIEIAAACKKAIRESGLSRDQVLDRINELFGRNGPETAAGPDDLNNGSKPLSLPMFNHYLSKPHEYKIQPWLLQGICRVTGSLEPLEPLVSPLGARIVSAEETTELMLGKLEAQIRESRRLKTQLAKQLAARQAG